MSEWLWRGYARCLRRIAFGDIPAVHDSRYRTSEGRLGNYSGASPSWARIVRVRKSLQGSGRPPTPTHFGRKLGSQIHKDGSVPE
jgi:hypothetical protein